jgi:hypothetical protein
MKKLIALSMFLVATTLPLFAHAGHAHTYMGTVTMLHGDHAFMMKTAEGEELMIQTSPKTTWAHQDGHVAQQGELALGDRVVVKMTTDGKSAASVKMNAPKKK